MAVIFVTGIDTGIGKTYVTGLMARFLVQKGFSVITQKLVQTGCTGISEDIILHRKIMGIELTPYDKEGLTCPCVLSFPSSPHLAARLENKKVDIERIQEATSILENKYDYVLLEGIGGVFVPLNESVTVLDFLVERKYPVVVITSPRLGSINHTLLTMEALARRNIAILGLFYNNYPDEEQLIVNDSRELFQGLFQDIPLVSIPRFDPDRAPLVDFSGVFRMQPQKAPSPQGKNGP